MDEQRRTNVLLEHQGKTIRIILDDVKDIPAMKKDISAMKGDVTVLKEDMQSVKLIIGDQDRRIRGHGQRITTLEKHG